MLSEEVIKQMCDKLRSSTVGEKKIKVIYFGESGGFNFGNVIEAKARHVAPTGEKYPYPKWKHCKYQIKDEGGDTFTVSDDGVSFHKGFYPVTDDFKHYLITIKKVCATNTDQ